MTIARRPVVLIDRMALHRRRTTPRIGAAMPLARPLLGSAPSLHASAAASTIAVDEQQAPVASTARGPHARRACVGASGPIVLATTLGGWLVPGRGLGPRIGLVPRHERVFGGAARPRPAGAGDCNRLGEP